MEAEPSNKEISKYNEAGYQIIRLHEYWVQAEVYANRGMFTKWKFILDSIWRELCSDVLRMQDKKEVIERNSGMIEKISEAENQAALYQALNLRHMFLKEVQDMSGKGGVYADENEGMWEQ